jgi:hypothetical protein
METLLQCTPRDCPTFVVILVVVLTGTGLGVLGLWLVYAERVTDAVCAYVERALQRGYMAIKNRFPLIEALLVIGVTFLAAGWAAENYSNGLETFVIGVFLTACGIAAACRRAGLT